MDVEDVREIEQREAVYAWRRRRFEELGFTRRQASRLAEEAADWHEAAALIAAGCPVELAFDLLT